MLFHSFSSIFLSPLLTLYRILPLFSLLSVLPYKAEEIFSITPSTPLDISSSIILTTAFLTILSNTSFKEAALSSPADQAFT